MRKNRVALIVLFLSALGLIALTPAAWAIPTVTASPSPLNFGSITTGTTATGDVTFTNHGASDLYYAGATILRNPGAFDFDQTFLASDSSSCANLAKSPAAPANGGTCVMQMTFSPTSHQGYRAFLVVNFSTDSVDPFEHITNSISVPLVGRGS